ncbi:MAG: carboxylesterase family protein, partial [Ilumatobacteraceae bacterium]
MEAPEARTPNGWIGLDRDGVSVFKGIPFANAERFEASETLPGTPGRADTYRPRSLQVPGLMERFLGGSNQSMDEDCLTLNIFTPDATARLPVMVWIHGGAFVNGSGSLPWYDGSALARRYGVVVVTVNYRLGLLGFTGEDDLGLGDQISALAWVRDNIAEFGGDPESVTVFGESAGGASVIALLAAPSAAGLLHRGIAMSPSMPQLRSRRRA